MNRIICSIPTVEGGRLELTLTDHSVVVDTPGDIIEISRIDALTLASKIYETVKVLHGVTPGPALPEVVQLPLTESEFKYIQNVIAFYQAVLERSAQRADAVLMLLDASPLQNDVSLFNAFAQKLNSIGVAAFLSTIISPEDLSR